MIITFIIVLDYFFLIENQMPHLMLWIKRVLKSNKNKVDMVTNIPVSLPCWSTKRTTTRFRYVKNAITNRLSSRFSNAINF